MLAILEVLWLFPKDNHEMLIVERDSSNTVAWVSHHKTSPWRFQYYFNEIREVFSIINVTFHQEVWLANSTENAIVKLRGWKSASLGGCHYVKGYNVLVPFRFWSFSFFVIPFSFNENLCYRSKKKKECATRTQAIESIMPQMRSWH